MSIKSAVSANAAKVLKGLRLVAQAPKLVWAIATVFAVEVYPISYGTDSKFTKKYDVKIVSSKRVFAATLINITRNRESHPAKTELLRQINSAFKEKYESYEDLDLYKFNLISFGKPSRATLRQHIQYLVLSRFAPGDALLVPETP